MTHLHPPDPGFGDNVEEEARGDGEKVALGERCGASSSWTFTLAQQAGPCEVEAVQVCMEPAGLQIGPHPASITLH